MWIDLLNIQEMYKTKTKQNKKSNFTTIAIHKGKRKTVAEQEKNKRIKSWGYKLSIVL